MTYIVLHVLLRPLVDFSLHYCTTIVDLQPIQSTRCWVTFGTTLVSFGSTGKTIGGNDVIDANFTDRTSCIFAFSMLVCTGYVGCDFAKYDVDIFNMI